MSKKGMTGERGSTKRLSIKKEHVNPLVGPKGFSRERPSRERPRERPRERSRERARERAVERARERPRERRKEMPKER